ncbi:hypothetical protein MASR2M117_14130 [Paludibacter sp.]
MVSCEPDSDFDFDKKLKFSKLTVEQQKQKIEDQGIAFANAIASIQDTKLFKTAEHAYELLQKDSTPVSAVMQMMKRDLVNNPNEALNSIDRQMRVMAQEDEDFWGEYVYNFTTKEMEKTKVLVNKVIVKFPSNENATTNDGLLTFDYTKSNVKIPDTEEYYPAASALSIVVGSNTLMTASMTGTYYDDGSPKKADNSLKIDDFEWTASFENNQSKATTSYEFKKGKQSLINAYGEIRGKLSKTNIENAINNEKLDQAFEYIAAGVSVMNIGVKTLVKDFKGFFNKMENFDEKGKTEKEIEEARAKIFNDYTSATAYFVKEDEKFADVKLEVVEKEYVYYDWDQQQQKPIEITIKEYNSEPVFVLSDGSKVSPEKFFATGFDNLEKKIEDLITPYMPKQQTIK